MRGAGLEYPYSPFYANHVRCWGSNNYGQLGCGDTTNRKDPRTVQLNSRVRSMHLGVYHTYAVLENDTVKYGSGTRMGILATARKRT